MSRWIILAAAGLLVLSFAGSAGPAEAGVACVHSQVTEWPVSAGGNGHFYRVACAFDDSTNADDAQSGAEAMGGNLVSLTFEAENSFVAALLTSRGYWDVDFGNGWCIGPIIGAYEPEGTEEPAGGWLWADGEPFAYDKWAPGQPDNFGGNDENRAFYFNNNCPGAFNATDEWHDVDEDDEARAFIVEWETRPLCHNTPVTQWRTEDGGNDHYYAVTCNDDDRITWDDAQAASEASGGHLATSTSAEENAFVFALADDPGFWNLTTYNCIVGPWLGGLQPAGSSEPDGGWKWVTDESFAYTNWDDGTPDDFDDDDRLIFWGGCNGPDRSPFWNDMVPDGRAEVMSYVTEWETPPLTQGDVNCDGVIDELDMMLLLEFTADANDGAQSAPCPDVNEPAGDFNWGDLNCDGAIDGLDALFVLLFKAELDTPGPAGQCFAMGNVIT